MDHTSELSTARTLAISAQSPGMLLRLSVVIVVFTVTITTCASNYDSWVPCGSMPLSCSSNLHGEVLGSRQEHTAEKGSVAGLELANEARLVGQ